MCCARSSPLRPRGTSSAACARGWTSRRPARYRSTREGAALLLAIVAVLLPPLSIIAVGFLAWLLLGGRRRSGEKYAGLRVLR